MQGPSCIQMIQEMDAGYDSGEIVLIILTFLIGKKFLWYCNYHVTNFWIVKVLVTIIVKYSDLILILFNSKVVAFQNYCGFVVGFDNLSVQF